MRVGVDEARQNGLTTEIDLSNAGGRKIHNVGVFPDREKSAARYGNSFCNRLSGIHGHDVAVMENQVRFFLLEGKKRDSSKRAEKFTASCSVSHGIPFLKCRGLLRMLRCGKEWRQWTK